MSNNSNVQEPIYTSEYLLETDVLRSGLKKVRIKATKRLGEKFHDNLNNISYMIMLPHILLSIEHAKSTFIPYKIMAAVKAKIETMSTNGNEIDNHYAKAMKEIFETEIAPKMEKTIDDALSNSEKIFLDLLKTKGKMKLQEAYQALLYSSAVWIWCSFEVLMKELWEIAGNMGGRYLIKNIIKNLRDEPEGFGSGIQRKSISLDYLARYDYDLSNKLGTALLYKFDFTSLNGIKDAYRQAFPRSETIKNALNNEKIAELEAARNVIVHNAGIIDEEYCEKTNKDMTEVGKNLELNSHKVTDYGNSTRDIGLCIILAISSILLPTKSLKPK